MMATAGIQMIFVSLLLLFVLQVKTNESSNISGLINNLLTGYDKRIRPNFYGPPVDVSVTMFVLSISSISEVNMDFTMDFYFRQYWNDPRLKFQRRPGVDHIVLDSATDSLIWEPDTFFANEKMSYYHHTTVPNAFTKISSNGDVTKSVRLTTTASCPMNLKHFPMDSQLCFLEMESYGFTAKDIRYQWKFGNNNAGHSVGIALSVELPQFRVAGHRQVANTVSLSSGNYSRLAVELLFVRSTGYYILQIYFPAFLIVVVSWVAFWLNKNNMLARVALAVTTVLTITTLMATVNASLPKISYIKIIDVYLIFCFVMVFAALVEHAVIDFISSRTFMPLVAAPYAKNVEGGTMNSMVSIMDADKDGQGQYYGGKQQYVDKFSRIGFPVVFLCFNVLYYIICSMNSNVSIDNMIPMKAN